MTMRPNRVVKLLEIAERSGERHYFRGMWGMMEYFRDFGLVEYDFKTGTTSITTRGLCALEVALEEHARHGRDVRYREYRHPDGSIKWRAKGWLW